VDALRYQMVNFACRFSADCVSLLPLMNIPFSAFGPLSLEINGYCQRLSRRYSFRAAVPLPVLFVQARDALDNLCCLGVMERRAATHAIPSEQQFKCYCRIDTMP
jgi:hypothetical protein